LSSGGSRAAEAGRQTEAESQAGRQRQRGRQAEHEAQEPGGSTVQKFLRSLRSHNDFHRMPLRGSQNAPFFREKLLIFARKK